MLMDMGKYSAPFTAIALTLTIFWCAASAGRVHASGHDRIIVGPTSSTVYAVHDGQRYAFPDSQTYFTWFTNFNNVERVTGETLADLPLAGVVTARPGVRMVKVQSDPKTYVVTIGGKLRWVETEEIANRLYGSSWSRAVMDVSPSFFSHYTIGPSLTDATQVSLAQERAVALGSDLVARLSSPIYPDPSLAPPSFLAKPEWQQKLDAITMPNIVTGTSQDGYYLENGPYRVTFPEYSERIYAYGKFRLHQLEVCYEQIEEYLGPPPQGVRAMWEEYRISPDANVSSCCDETSQASVVTLITRDRFDALIESDGSYWKRDGINFDTCLGGHEEVHRLVQGYHLNHQFNEGLATYIEEELRKKPGTSATSNIRECKERSFIIGSGEEIPFRRLISEFYDEPGYQGYYTAACFWDHVVQTHGRAALRNIVQRLYSVGEKPDNGYDYLFTHAVFPVVGTGIRSYAEDMIGYPLR